MDHPFFSRITPKLILLNIVVVTSLTLTGCASVSQDNPYSDPKDPLETINRSMWTFNWDYLDKYVTGPASRAYVKYTPTPLRTGVYNMARNLDEPASIVNNLLQLKFSDAAITTGRFVLNSTVGLLGFFDPASDFGWTRKEEEFGEVLGVYGVGNGPYLMIPFIGPSAVRDEVGNYVDRSYWPIALISFWPNVLRLTIKGLEDRAAIAPQESIINESIDPYTFVKNAYFQNMRYKVYDGNPPVEENTQEEDNLDSFLDEADDSKN